MADPATARQLKEIPIFQNLRPKELALLTLVMKRKQFPAGTDICVQGEPGNSCFFILEGGISVLRKQSSDSYREIARLGPHELFGQIALVDQGPRSATCRAVVDSELLQLDANDFEMLFNSGSQFAFRFQELIAKHAVKQLRSATKTLEEARTQRLGNAEQLRTAHDLLLKSDSHNEESS
jgi:CRP/FNR family transcriptional regulator